MKLSHGTCIKFQNCTMVQLSTVYELTLFKREKNRIDYFENKEKHDRNEDDFIIIEGVGQSVDSHD
ncbi:hypothetical protein BpHYR1_046278 [Brachionus plicatilis]|uniref:Uncharacterized protein n=1 Tax=Brachionus plicatilis TaxID=10195 RepID=A0A3M7PYZ2_BRAPC|nr:hypothetical protein BpHYR1_046278 [Brachionus plicatilis]